MTWTNLGIDQLLWPQLAENSFEFGTTYITHECAEVELRRRAVKNGQSERVLTLLLHTVIKFDLVMIFESHTRMEIQWPASSSTGSHHPLACRS